MEVIVYSKDNCGQCLGAKMFLNSKGIKFDERAIDKNEQYREEMVDGLGLTSLPVVLVKQDGELVSEPIVGNDPVKLTEIFGKLG